jgi:hypothetical protein
MTVTALVATGAAACFTGAGLASGTLDLGLTSRAWAAAGALAIFSTVLPIAAFLAGMRRSARPPRRSSPPWSSS